MLQRALGVALFAALPWLLGCSDDDPGTHFCVGDKTDSQDCTVTWELRDPCGSVANAASVEIALFDGACPESAALIAGDTSAALMRSSFTPGNHFSPIDGLDTAAYGFAFLARDESCGVRAFGCTPAHLGAITTIRTAVCDWSTQDGSGAPSCACTTLAGGACPSGQTCSSGICQG